jgi:hypothetical protein
VLKLRRGHVVSEDPLIVRIGEVERPAWADEHLVGPCEQGDEVVVNVEALDLNLGSGGFDIVHVNLTRGLEAPGASGSHVMKLNYSSLQHPVEPVERGFESPAPARALPVAVISLHGHLAPLAWAAAQTKPGLRLGFVQSVGAAVTGSLSRDVRELRDRGSLCGHITAGQAFGGEDEAITVAGALDAVAAEREWDAVVVGPGPGILGSATKFGHGGIVALENAHAALALALRTLLCPRLSSSDPRERHRGLSHHSASVLQLLLGSVTVPVPLDGGWPGHAEALEELRVLCEGRHDLAAGAVDVGAYGASGLPRRTMGRDIEEDPLFFAAPLAAGAALAGAV